MTNKLNDKELEKAAGGYDNSELCLPAGIHVQYRVWTSSTEWTARGGIIMRVDEKEGTYFYDILRDMSSIRDYVKAADLYFINV